MVYGRRRHHRTAGASSRKALAKLVVLLANDEIASSVTLLISQLNSAFAIRFLWESFSSDNPAVLLHTVHCDFSSPYPQALHAVGVALPAHNALRLFFSQLLLHARVFSKISARHTLCPAGAACSRALTTPTPKWCSCWYGTHAKSRLLCSPGGCRPASSGLPSVDSHVDLVVSDPRRVDHHIDSLQVELLLILLLELSPTHWSYGFSRAVDFHVL